MKVMQVLPELESGGVERGTLELADYLVSNVRGHRRSLSRPFKIGSQGLHDAPLLTEGCSRTAICL